MDLLVVGANGLLGSNVISQARQRDWNVSGTFYRAEPDLDIALSQFDLREYAAFDELLEQYRPDVVVNCAAMTDVDACERDPEGAHVVNGEAPGELAKHCERAGVDFVHVSTDYVFDGRDRNPYDETATPSPLQAYGQSKLAGERAVRDASSAALVARLSFVWGVHRGSGELTGFPSWVRARIRSGESVPLFTDQWVSPTRAGQAAETLLDLVAASESGLYHIACRSCVTPYEFGAAITERIGGADLLQRGSTDDVDRDAPRPTDSCLDVERVEATLGRPQPTLREDIDAVWNST